LEKALKRLRRNRPRSVVLAAFAAVFIAALVVAPGAFASTLTQSGGTLTYTPAATDTTGVVVSFGEPTAGSIEVVTNDSDPITSAPSPACTGTTGTTSDFTCTGVTSVVASAPNFDSQLDSAGGFGSMPTVADIPVTLNGGSGIDNLTAGSSTTTLNGGDGNDTLNAGTGADTLSGGNGNDSLNPGNATDTVSGGAGIDQVFYSDNTFVTGTGGAPDSIVATPVNVSLDGVANDGYAGNNSNIGTDVEDVTVGDESCTGATIACAYGGATLTGDSGPNMLSGGAGNDTLTGGGGGDFLSGNLGNNTLNGVNGYPDRLDCGGTGTANADQLDTVAACTTVNTTKLANVGLLTQDKAPTVSWRAPRENAKINPSKSNTFQVSATPGTHPITKVVYYIGERTACITTTAPYKCAFKGKDTDVGKDTLVAITTDSIGLTSTLTRSITVSTFKPKKLTASTTPKRAKHAPFVFTTSGRLTLPSGVSKRKGCTGTVSVTFKDGKNKVGSGTAKLRSSCSFSSRMKVAVPNGAKALQVSVVFGGNTTLSKASAKGYKVKIG
jgi:RTX calcium-binding nonapeptide repeat (4 copies)/Bacterial Ig domain